MDNAQSTNFVPCRVLSTATAGLHGQCAIDGLRAVPSALEALSTQLGSAEYARLTSLSCAILSCTKIMSDLKRLTNADYDDTARNEECASFTALRSTDVRALTAGAVEAYHGSRGGV